MLSLMVRAVCFFFFITMSLSVSANERVRLTVSSKPGGITQLPAKAGRPYAVYGIEDFLYLQSDKPCEAIAADWLDAAGTWWFQKNSTTADIHYSFDVKCHEQSANSRSLIVSALVGAVSEQGNHWVVDRYKAKPISFYGSSFQFIPPTKTMTMVVLIHGGGRIASVQDGLPDLLSILVDVPFHKQQQLFDQLAAIIRLSDPLERREKMIEFLVSALPEWSREELENYIDKKNETSNTVVLSTSVVAQFELSMKEFMSTNVEFIRCEPAGFKCYSKEPLRVAR